MLISFPDFTVRDWRRDDASALAWHANDRRSRLNMRYAFPHPCTLADAEAFLAFVADMRPRSFFAISAEIGDWLEGRPSWEGSPDHRPALYAILRVEVGTALNTRMQPMAG